MGNTCANACIAMDNDEENIRHFRNDTDQFGNDRNFYSTYNKNFLFSIGIIADPQYANIEDGQNYSKNRNRRYRQALQISKNAIEVWNSLEFVSNGNESEFIERPLCVICMGDIIDFLNVEHHASEESMKTMLSVFNRFQSSNPGILLRNINSQSSTFNYPSSEPKTIISSSESKSDEFSWLPRYPYFHNLVGNHEVYNFNRHQLCKYQYSSTNYCSTKNVDENVSDDISENEMKEDDVQFYYSFSPWNKFLFIMLDAFVISVHGYEYCNNEHYNYLLAEEILAKYNHHENKNIPPVNEDDEYNVRYAAFNGCFGEKQLEWLREQLEIAQIEKYSVFIFSHVPIVDSNNVNIAWDFQEMKDLIEKYSCVKCFFAGHNHDGDENITQESGIIYKTFAGVIEADLNQNCFGIIEFYENDLCKIKGYGMIKDCVYKLKPF